MPSIAVDEQHCLYVGDGLPESERFQKQCQKILNWNELHITPWQLFGLKSPVVWETLAANKKELFLKFHPDKNPDQTELATSAFIVLQAAFEYLCSKEKDIPESLRSSSILGNPFAATSVLPDINGVMELFRKMNDIFKDYLNSEAKFEAKKQEYLSRLDDVCAAEYFSEEDEAFFRASLTKPQYPGLVIIGTKKTLGMGVFFLAITKGGSKQFFEFLVSLLTNQVFKDRLLMNAPYDVFALSLLHNRLDCLKTLLDAYGVEELKSSNIDGLLPEILIKNPSAISSFQTLMQWGYNSSCNLNKILSDYIKKTPETEDSFEQLYSFLGYLKKCAYPLDYNQLLQAIISAGHIRLVRKMDQEKWINPATVEPVHLAAPNQIPETIRYLRENNYKITFTYKEDKHYLLDLLKSGAEVSDLLKSCTPDSKLWEDADFLMGLLNKDPRALQIWIQNCSLANLSQTALSKILDLMNQQQWEFSEQQISFLETQFTLLTMTGFINQAENTYLLLFKELIKQKHLSANEVYQVPLTLYNPHTKDSVVLENYTVFHLCLALKEPLLAVSVLEQGADWHKKVCITESKKGNTTTTTNSLRYAQAHGLKPVVGAIALKEARHYLKCREKEDNYKSKISFFGYEIAHFGFSKTQKIEAVNSLINFLQKNEPIPEIHKPALNQGRLGKIAQLILLQYAPELKSNLEQRI